VPVRIYAFAKQLELDNKQLLDICEKVGIKGKGSALASLDDDEIAKIKSFMEGGDSTNGSTATAATTLPVPPPTKPKPLPPPVPTRDKSPLRKGPLRDLDSIKKKNTEAAADKEKKKKAELVVNLAAMPDVQQPTTKSTDPTEKVQKPDISLPQDAIKKAREGSTAPLEQFTKKDKVKKKGKGAKTGGVGLKQDVLGDMPSTSRRSGVTKRKDPQEKEMASGSGLGNTRQLRARRNRPIGAPASRRTSFQRRFNRGRSGPVANTAAPRKEAVVLQLPTSVREFSEATGVSAGKVLLTVQQLGDESVNSINSSIADEFVELLIENFEIENVDVRQPVSLEDQLITGFDIEEEDEAALESRAPIVTFLGHVDHGKTSLLDALIGIDVVSGEAGGITQHIRAYEIKKGDNKIAFVDTPGHEAFTEMRARGANVTDIAVLVVAADDGVMPQTEEAISHAKAAEVPIVVALNKIDLPGANPDKALQDLAAHDLLPSEWGGEIEVVRTSAIAGTGLDELLETIQVTAELHELKANFSRPAFGTCLEAAQQPGKGVIAKMMVQGGTLNVGDVIVCGSAHGRVKAMYDTLHPRKKLKTAGPSTPVNLTGLDVAPEAGDKFYVLDDIVQAREIASSREFKSRQKSLSGITTKVSLEEIQRRLETGNLADTTAELITLNLIIRADVRGSIEAIEKELKKIEHPEIRIRVLQSLVGGVTVADVRLAQASEAVIIGFNVVPDEAARSLADEVQVEIRRYDVIYKVTDDLRATLEGRLKPEEHVVEQGMAMVLQTFNISKAGTIAGCRVMRGSIQRECRIRVIRDSRVIGDYAIDSLKRVKDDAKEVQRGMECGIKLAGFNDVKEGDTLEAYKIEEVARTL